MKKKVEETTIQIKFSNKAAAMHFADWLCGSGEQQYWSWMECRESDNEENDLTAPITATEFHYHGEEDNTKAKNDPKRYGEFMCDNIIRTTCGRLDRNE